ncbi:pyridoxamine 5'-phosphate oxidase family protein [Massilia sp. TS11]|uniref:pyridoxamine 5'-phosphate oxidase family protein n=1 Tax=Massilia sp. TS11 TaxID=2908003 RepID=UPI001EDB1966|nr:pyridoxamine 5'-phosphate oxidase family protein [Massilia sp. TS11]MCG2585041.1 pyridoxamine 5'-phosphate oxidase family protein [Massilia sp. TS11]
MDKLNPHPFHPGEQAMQARAGVAARMQEVGQRVIRDHMPEQHQAFYAQLPWLVAASVDAHGRPWAGLLSGAPGFAQAIDARHLRIAALPAPADPFAAGLYEGAALGLLGIALPTRRRNRVNGRIDSLDREGITLAVEQTTGNCPQYITVRSWPGPPAGRAPAQALSALDADARALLARADTLFVASAAPGHGADASHRGGAPGFVRQEADGSLLLPDYRGNFFFMSLGNFLLHPRAGLLIPDFASGGLLELSGSVSQVDDPAVIASLPHAERAWRFHPEAAWRS